MVFGVCQYASHNGRLKGNRKVKVIYGLHWGDAIRVTRFEASQSRRAWFNCAVMAPVSWNSPKKTGL